MPYNVEEIRNQLKKQGQGKFNDPDEFKPERAKSDTEAIQYRFWVLPPILEGDVLKSGVVEKSMEQFFLSHGNHWIDNKPYPCPRLRNGDECKACTFGFDLMKEYPDDEEQRKIIREQWMPQHYSMVNIFFTGWKGNPEPLRNKVKFFNASKTCVDLWTAAIYREDCGDEEDPQAFGVFYDERAAFQFQLNVLKQGRNNSYKTSKFLGQGGKPVPMIANKDGSPNEKAIETLLKLRHNLWTKIDPLDVPKLNKVVAVKISGDDPDDAGGGFDTDETATKSEKKPEEKKDKPKPPKKEKAKEEPKKPAPEPVEEDDDDDAATRLAEQMEESSDDSLADEAPLKEEAPKEEKKEEDKVPVPDDSGDGEEDDDISALMAQLEDDD